MPPYAEPPSRFGAAIDWVAVVGFGLGWGALLVALATAVGAAQAAGWLLVLLVPAVLAVDLAAGLFHWFADTFLTPNTRWIGPTVIRSFREHHGDPKAIARRGAVEASGQNCLVCLPLLVIGAGASRETSLDAALLAGLLLFTLGIALTNRFHQWAHADRVPRWVAALQGRGLILAPERHSLHHRGAHDRAYCVTTGWLNPLLDSIEFFARLERTIRWFDPRRRPEFARTLRSD